MSIYKCPGCGCDMTIKKIYPALIMGDKIDPPEAAHYDHRWLPRRVTVGYRKDFECLGCDAGTFTQTTRGDYVRDKE